MNWKCKLTSILILLMAITFANGQGSSPPETFASFWKTFKAAIAKNDKQAVADLTKLPLLMDNREQDRAGFIRMYNQLFTRKIRRCIATAKPIKEQEGYDIFCGEVIFYFARDKDGRYKFFDFGAND
jgi:hypothetical protein